LSKLYRSATDGSAEVEVLEGVLMRGFVVLEDCVYYLHPEPGGAAGLRVYMLETGQDSLISLIAKPVSLGLSLSPDCKHILYSQMDHRGADLMLLDSFK
jgi:hypothetical protein